MKRVMTCQRPGERPGERDGGEDRVLVKKEKEGQSTVQRAKLFREDISSI